MKVILLENIKGLGHKNDVKEVSDGYARNFLLPRNLAVQATGSEIEKLQRSKKEAEIKLEKLISELKMKAKRIEELTFHFTLKVGEKGETFGSLHKKDLEEKIKEAGFGDVEVSLDKPIKTTGEILVPVDLGEKVKTKVRVVVKPE